MKMIHVSLLGKGKEAAGCVYKAESWLRDPKLLDMITLQEFDNTLGRLQRAFEKAEVPAHFIVDANHRAHIYCQAQDESKALKVLGGAL